MSIATAVVVTLALTHHHSRTRAELPETESTKAPAPTPTDNEPFFEPFAPTVVDNWTITVQDWTFATGYRGRSAGHGQKWLVVDATVTNGNTRSRPFDAHTIVELGNCSNGRDRYRVDQGADQPFRNAVYNPTATILRRFVFRIPTTVNNMFLLFHPRGEATLNCA